MQCQQIPSIWPIKDVVPYLMRRAQENTSIGGQTGRELALISKEIKRRGL
jgi:proline dehydrogenase